MSVQRSQLDVLALRHLVPLPSREIELTRPGDRTYYCLGWFELDSQSLEVFARRVETAPIFFGILQHEAWQVRASCFLNMQKRAACRRSPEIHEPIMIWTRCQTIEGIVFRNSEMLSPQPASHELGELCDSSCSSRKDIQVEFTRSCFAKDQWTEQQVVVE